MMSKKQAKVEFSVEQDPGRPPYLQIQTEAWFYKLIEDLNLKPGQTGMLTLTVHRDEQRD